jgi:hypothetical protein
MVKRTTSIDKLWSFHGLALALHAQALLDGIVATTWDERTRLVRSVGVENPWRKPVQYVQCTMYNVQQQQHTNSGSSALCVFFSAYFYDR